MQPAMAACQQYEALPAYGPLGVSSETAIAELPSARRFDRGTQLTLQGTQLDEVYWIESGVVKQVCFHLNGQEMIIGLRTKGWIIGAVPLLSGALTRCTAITVTTCSLRPISRQQFEDLYSVNLNFTRHVGVMLAAELGARMSANIELRHSPARQRLEHFLKECAAPAENRVPNEEFRLKQTEIAQILSVTPEHLSRLYNQMEDEGSFRRELAHLVRGVHA
jgi:CRP-like cAMP-binding protein